MLRVFLTFTSLRTTVGVEYRCIDRGTEGRGPPWGENASRCKDVKRLHCPVRLHHCACTTALAPLHHLLHYCTPLAPVHIDCINAHILHHCTLIALPISRRDDCAGRVRGVRDKRDLLNQNMDHRWWHPSGSHLSDILFSLLFPTISSPESQVEQA